VPSSSPIHLQWSSQSSQSSQSAALVSSKQEVVSSSPRTVSPVSVQQTLIPPHHLDPTLAEPFFSIVHSCQTSPRYRHRRCRSLRQSYPAPHTHTSQCPAAAVPGCREVPLVCSYRAIRPFVVGGDIQRCRSESATTTTYPLPTTHYPPTFHREGAKLEPRLLKKPPSDPTRLPPMHAREG
jgi:hypothetical protein